jgi:hypothetical protein
VRCTNDPIPGYSKRVVRAPASEGSHWPGGSLHPTKRAGIAQHAIRRDKQVQSHTSIKLARNANQGCEICGKWTVACEPTMLLCPIPVSPRQTCATVSTSPRARHGGLETHRLASGETHMFSRQFAAKVAGRVREADMQLSPTACHAARVVVQKNTTASAAHATLMLFRVSA